MRHLLLSTALPQVVASSAAPSGQEYSVTGMVLSVDRARLRFTASIQEIRGFMTAMTMPFEVRQGKDLEGLVPGAAVEFTLVVTGNSSHAERIRVVRYQSTEERPYQSSD